MAEVKVYAAPDAIKKPEINFDDIKAYEKDCDKYEEDLRAFCLRRRKGKYTGKVIQFQVADGYARYMVAGNKPMELIHIDLWDGYHFEYVDLLTDKKVIEQIHNQEKLEKLFPKRNLETSK